MVAKLISGIESTKTAALDIMGSSTFGRDPKILASRTFNMIVSDGWLVDYFGYKKVVDLVTQGNGRGIFNSVRASRIIAVSSNKVFSIEILKSPDNKIIYEIATVGTINSFNGNVFIDENNNRQIAICDQHDLYIYDYRNNSFQKANLPDGVIPTYVTYQNGRFIIPDSSSSAWYLSQVGNGLDWFWGNSGEPVFGAIQTKPDFCQATLRFPGRGNLLLVMGKTVTEPWVDVGNPLFPYQRSTSLNFDYGCVSPASIATSDENVAWIGINENSGPVLMYSNGSDVKQISTDGINYKLSQLNNPSACSAFFVKLSGHLIYQFTFYDPLDNLSLIYDFTTKQFFDVTDENMNYHIAVKVAFFQNEYYFIDYNDGDLYQMSAEYTTFDYRDPETGDGQEYEIPRIRVCNNFRLPDAARYSINRATFTIEQGSDSKNLSENKDYKPRISMSMSKDGGYQFGSYATREIYFYGRRMNRLNWWNLGAANDFIPQFRFWGKGPWKCTNGLMEYSK